MFSLDSCFFIFHFFTPSSAESKNQTGGSFPAPPVLSKTEPFLRSSNSADPVLVSSVSLFNLKSPSHLPTWFFPQFQSLDSFQMVRLSKSDKKGPTNMFTNNSTFLCACAPIFTHLLSTTIPVHTQPRKEEE